MVLVVEKKFLEEDWWKYPLALFLLQLTFWTLLGYRLNPHLGFFQRILGSYVVLFAFLATAFLPFVAGRLQFRTLFWSGFAGFLLGLAAYYALSLMKVGEQFNLLPFIAFMQVYVACFSLGLVIEFGRYVLRKLTE
ncbi:MAG TPA: hypothetical protein VL283_01865 [Candidatus Baltobacteraceae bacterium]|nr:hypothetical protein [Candidatus Baltobacteraceae bacterium]